MRRRDKKSGQSRLWQKTFIAMVAIALLAALLMAGAIHLFFKNSQIERRLEKMIGHALRADVSLKPLAWKGAWISAQGLNVRGREDSVIKKAEGLGLRMNWNWRELFSGVLRLDEIFLEDLQAEFQPPESPRPLRDSEVFIPIPLHFQLDRIVIEKADLAYRNISAHGPKLLIAPQANGELKISGSGGVLRVPQLPPLEIQSVRGRGAGGRFYLEESRFSFNQSGLISATGQSGPDAALRVDWRGLPARPFLGESYGKYLNGQFSGTCNLLSSGPATGQFQIENATIDNVLFLDQIAAFTGISAMEKLPVQSLSANFSYENEDAKFSNVILESPGLLKVEGSLWIKSDGTMSGNLQLGVARNLVASLPGARETIFTSQRDGFLWTPVKLGGTLEMPREDLSTRLAPIIASSLLLKNAPKALETVPAPAIDAIKDILDIFLPPSR